MTRYKQSFIVAASESGSDHGDHGTVQIELDCTTGIDLEVNFETGEIISNLPSGQALSVAEELFPQWIVEVALTPAGKTRSA